MEYVGQFHNQGLTATADEGQPAPIGRRGEFFHVLLRPAGRENSWNFLNLARRYIVPVEEGTLSSDDCLLGKIDDSRSRKGRDE